jgi:predicted SprT family Zn-dependent metalloprotease
MARDLMNQHGLTDWHFSWDGARARFGCCNYTQKRITLSVHLVDLNTEERCRLTVLHEIAHALAGHKAGHGYEWRRICRAIGGNAQRCFTAANTEAPKGSLKATCARCGHEHTRFRMPRGRTWCARCGIRPAHHPELVLRWYRVVG